MNGMMVAIDSAKQIVTVGGGTVSGLMLAGLMLAGDFGGGVRNTRRVADTDREGSTARRIH